jgi:hypothetical protein
MKFLTAMSMRPETQNMKLKRNMVYLTQEEMYVNPLGIRRLILVGLQTAPVFLLCVEKYNYRIGLYNDSSAFGFWHPELNLNPSRCL